MTDDDIIYVKKVLAAGLIASPCLELGVGYEGGKTLREVVTAAGIAYVGTDMIPGPAVDYVVDFEAAPEVVQANLPQAGTFGTVLVLNVLEHTFEPIKVLDNVMAVLKPGGTCVIVTPAVWPLHNYPYDCCRLLPNFYEEYSKRRCLELLDSHFEYVEKGQVRSGNGAQDYAFPKPGKHQFRRTASRIIHKVFNTTGREMFFPSHIAIGAVLRKPR